MKQAHILILLVIFFVFQSSTCKKEKQEKLPGITQEGKNTFGCFVNGEVFLPSGPALSGGTLSAVYGLVNGKLSLRIASSNSKNGVVQKIEFISEDIELAEGQTYNLQTGTQNSNIVAIYQKSENQRLLVYQVTEPLGGELHIIKLDVEKRILSGTFWFDAKNQDSTVQVRDGRFDLKLQ